MVTASKSCEHCSKEYAPCKYNGDRQKYCSHHCWRRSTKWLHEKNYRLKYPEKKMLHASKSSAKRRGLEFNLTLDDIVIPDVCPVLGIPMDSPSIDRFDNNKGYTKDNVRIISLRANRLKNNATVEELEKIIKYMKDNNNG